MATSSVAQHTVSVVATFLVADDPRRFNILPVQIFGVSCIVSLTGDGRSVTLVSGTGCTVSLE